MNIITTRHAYLSSSDMFVLFSCRLLLMVDMYATAAGCLKELAWAWARNKLHRACSQQYATARCQSCIIQLCALLTQVAYYHNAATSALELAQNSFVLKEGYSSLQTGLPSPLRELTCHMGSHSVTCHPARVVKDTFFALFKYKIQNTFENMYLKYFYQIAYFWIGSENTKYKILFSKCISNTKYMRTGNCLFVNSGKRHYRSCSQCETEQSAHHSESLQFCYKPVKHIRHSGREAAGLAVTAYKLILLH